MSEIKWSNPKYKCGEHCANNKHPTEEGGKCFKLTCLDGSGGHYFDNEHHAMELGWKPLEKGAKS